jgi:DNA polymerase III epsilon subunit-like protein
MDPYSKKFISLDLETTHLDPREGKIMEVGAVEVELYVNEDPHTTTQFGVGVKFGKSYSSLVNPEIEPSAEALILTGISAEDLKAAPSWKDVKPILQKFIKDQVLAGHNFGFDLDFLANQGLRLKNEYFDSLELAQTFCPDIPSFSLEYLIQEFGIQAESSHRASSDSQSSAYVLAAALNRFLSFDLKLQEKIRGYLERSKLNFRNLILDLPKAQGKKLPRPKTKLPENLNQNPEFGEFLKAWPDKTLILLPLGFREEQAVFDLLAGLKNPGIVAAPSAGFLAGVPENQRLTHPSWAFCENRLTWLESQEALGDFACKILIKIAILKSFSNLPDLSLLRWTKGEREALKLVQVNPEVCLKHNCGYVKGLRLKEHYTHFLDPEALFRLVKDWKLNWPEIPALFFDLARIEDEFSQSLSEIWNLRSIRREFSPLYALDPGTPAWFSKIPKGVEEIANELDLFFGILHLVYRKNEGDFAENVVLDETESRDERFEKLSGAALKLLEKLKIFTAYLEEQISLGSGELAFELLALQKKIQSFLEFVQEFFFERKESNVYWLRFNNEWVDLGAMPQEIKSSWKKFSQNFASSTIIDAKLPRTSLTYFLNRLGINDYREQELCIAEPKFEPKIKIFPKARSRQEQIELLKSLEGRSLVILPSEAKLKEIYKSILAEKVFVQSVLAYKYSGNLHVVERKFHERENALLLLTSRAFLRYLFKLPLVQNLVIWKLPFEAPGNRPAVLMKKDANSFMTEVLPRAVCLLHTILIRFFKASTSKPQVFILDPRVLTDYDQEFYKYLAEVVEPSGLEIEE